MHVLRAELALRVVLLSREEPTHSMSCRSQTSFQGTVEVRCLGPIRTDAGVCDDGGVETGGMRLTVAIHGCSGI